jgi:hypothetical protein
MFSEGQMMKCHSRLLLFFSCLGLIALVLPVWVFASRQNPQLSNLTEGELKQIAVRLERSGCYGNCPAYKLTIHGDGRVEYEGADNVKVKGKKDAVIDLADVKRIVSEFDKAAYFSIEQFTEEKCSCTLCTDMPTATTEIQVKGTSHRVEYYFGCGCAPKALWALEEAIDKIARTEQWTGDVSKQGPFGTTCFRK